MGGILRKASRPEGTVHLKKKRLQKPCKDYVKGTCTNPSCDPGASSLCARITNHKQAEILSRSVSFLHREADRQTKKKTKEGVKGSLTFIKKVKELGGETQDAVSPMINSISRKGRKSSRPNLRLRYTEDALGSMKLRDRQGPLLVVVIQPAHSHERSCSLHKFEDRTQEDTLDGIWQKMCKQNRGHLYRNSATFFFSSEVWCLPTPFKIAPEERCLSWTPVPQRTCSVRRI